ncbi:hypothetical protein I7I53_05493 [Histoplasma capsulatum var. duboisii H88]|uniref:Uncharacterized protein n=1 Tax=Ajellomyces capsulatus (strain H88) TaxID=544711 RepID=A0A8A1LS78_AJEC8|nr:hypothetical protein I7I53_05493 [Histoplasma capsulatum var. duboisii H88]
MTMYGCPYKSRSSRLLARLNGHDEIAVILLPAISSTCLGPAFPRCPGYLGTRLWKLPEISRYHRLQLLAMSPVSLPLLTAKIYPTSASFF